MFDLIVNNLWSNIWTFLCLSCNILYQRHEGNCTFFCTLWVWFWCMCSYKTTIIFPTSSQFILTVSAFNILHSTVEQWLVFDTIIINTRCSDVLTWTGAWSRWDAKQGSKDLQEDWFIFCWLSFKCGALEMQRNLIIPPSYRRPLKCKWLLQGWLHRQTLLRWPQWPYHNPGRLLIPIAAQKTITRSLETTTMIIITTTGMILLK